LLLDIAIWLFERKRLSLAWASKLAELDIISFNKALAERGLTIHYTENDLDNDLSSLKKLFPNQ
jgi:predicted HTH domain antitoxin